MKRLQKTLAMVATAGLLSVLLTSCASIVNGQNQPISVSTYPVGGATCSLTNNKGTWYIPYTPNSVIVQRSYNDLHVVCQKKGYGIGETLIRSHTKPMAFGNIIFGGVVGAGVDIADGAAYDYPSNIVIHLHQ